jgi:uncharacterized protein YjiS (DUF1127 family)
MTLISTLGRFAGLSSDKGLTVKEIYSVFRQRQHLARLDDAALNDIGLTRKDVEIEIKRPIWDV